MKVGVTALLFAVIVYLCGGHANPDPEPGGFIVNQIVNRKNCPGCFQYNTAYKWNTNIAVVYSESAENCQKICQNTDSCDGWTYKTYLQQCRLKDFLEIEVFDADAISGPRNCIVDGDLCDRDCNGIQYQCIFDWWIQDGNISETQCKGRDDNSTSCFGDGYARPITVITKDVWKPTIPGPRIAVCEGDLITIKMNNTISRYSATIHWHGLHMVPYCSGDPDHTGNCPGHYYEDSVISGMFNVTYVPTWKGEHTQWADGVPYVTQCPTEAHHVFTYNFSAVPSGTYWYHSHVAYERDDGAYGSLVVREQPGGPTLQHLSDAFKNNVNLNEICDKSNNTITVMDWYQNSSIGRDERDFNPSSILVNGKGRSKIDTQIPWQVFTLDQTKDHCTDKNYYRFRIIGTQSLNCKIQISIDKNPDSSDEAANDPIDLTIIATDGQYVEPTNVKSFIIANGERYDFIIPATPAVFGQQIYTLRIGGVPGMTCRGLSAIAFVQYGESNDINQDENSSYNKSINVPGKCLNGYYGDHDIPITNLTSAYLFKYNGTADKTFYMQMTGHYWNNVAFIAQIMGKPLLSQGNELDASYFCSPDIDTDGDFPNTPNNSCYHVVNVDLGDVVDIFLISPANYSHPIHKHGYHFRVLHEEMFHQPNASHNYVQEIKQANEAGDISRNYDHPVKKDTLQSLRGGWQLIRIHANNRGYWITHCHITYHHINGMNFVIKVGNRNDWIIPEGFPTCSGPLPGVNVTTTG